MFKVKKLNKHNLNKEENKSYFYKIFIAIIFLSLIWYYYFFHKPNNIDPWVKSIDTIVFSYPTWELDFAGEKVPMDDKHFSNKEKFDKEFLITSYNFYQLFLYIKRYDLYIPYIEEKLKENNIPDDFKYLAIAESGLRNDALSSASAAGIWQFIPETWDRFGLQIDDYVDERYNFEASTDAAMDYFKVLYNKFNDRTLVAASYNRWENGIQKALDNQWVDNYYDLYLNEETSRYVFRILAIKYIFKDYEKKKLVIDHLIWEKFLSPKIITVEVKKIDNLVEFAKSYKQSYSIIKLLNPWIIWDSLPDWKWEIKVLGEK